MRKIYVDYENVQSPGLDGVELLEEGDQVFLFYSVHAETMKMNIVSKLLASPAEILFIEAETGTINSLDFQLVAMLFMNIEMDKDYYIISKDAGFDPAVHIGVKRKYSVKRFSTLKQLLLSESTGEIGEADIASPDAEPEILSSVAKETSIAEAVPENTKTTSSLEVLSPVENIIAEKCGRRTAEKYGELITTGLKKSENKNQFYQFFRTNLGDAEGGDLYRSIRSIFEEMKSIIIQI